MSDPIEMKCPKCGQINAFAICADVWGLHTSEGFDSDGYGLPSYAIEWNENHGCMCVNDECDWGGVVQDARTAYDEEHNDER